MEFVMENIPALALSFVVPFSTMAAVAIGCGDNRQHAHKRNKRSNGQPVMIGNQQGSQKSSNRQPGQHHQPNAYNQQHAMIGNSAMANSNRQPGQHHQPSKHHHRSRSSSKGSSKHGSASSKHSSKKESRQPVPSKPEMKQKLKEAAKEASKKNSAGKEKTKHAIASKLPKKENMLSKKAASAEDAGRSSVSKSYSPYPPGPNKSRGRKISCPIDGPCGLVDVVLEPQQLNYSAKGGLQTITLRSNDSKRQAVKVKCSDNSLYRVNPVYTFLEPGKSVSLNVYRNSSAGNGNKKADKLVLALAKVSDSEKEPMKAFEGRNNKYPKLVMPLLVSGSNGTNARCPCVK